tara:strand:- start:239 stop:1045 length:807 start_codon:yes stop_codon:yes gene_type:complete
MYFLSVVLIGTVYPIFLEVLSSKKISVGPPFYYKLMIPFLIPFLFFMSIGPNLNWIKSEFKKIKIQIVLSFTVSLLISFIILNQIGFVGLINSILILVTFYLFFITIKDFFLKKYKNYSQIFSHFGFSLLILSILFNSILSSEKTINLKVGEEFSFRDETVIFESIESVKNKNYKSIVGNFKIKDKQNNFLQLKPELRIYNQPVTITSEADIKTTLYYDKFLVMNLVKDYEYFNVRYQVKPFMIWIWIATVILVIGGFLSLFQRPYEK